MGTSPEQSNLNVGSGSPSADRLEAPGGSFLRGRALPALAAAILVVALLGGALYGLGLGRGIGTTPSATPSATSLQPTDTPQPTATATAQPTVPVFNAQRICGPLVPVVSVGGLVVVKEVQLGNTAYPKARLADNAAQAPLVVDRTGNHPGADPAHPTNPFLYEMRGGYWLAICNMSTTPHTIGRVDVRLDSVTPYTAQLNEWDECSSIYSRTFGVQGGGCGGANLQDEYLHAPFAANVTAGTTVTATQTGTGDSGLKGNGMYGPLPVTLQPGQVMTIDVGMGPDGPGYQAFSIAGTYIFSFGLGVDGQAPVFALSSPPTLLAPPAHEWNGQACTSAAMQAQIPPATNPPTFYICPVS
jgi:hypothetical protein